MKSNRTKQLTCLYPSCRKILTVSVHAKSIHCNKHRTIAHAERQWVHNHKLDINIDVFDPVNPVNPYDPLKGFPGLFATVAKVSVMDYPDVLRLAGMGG